MIQTRKMIDEDLWHDPTFKRQREVAARLIGHLVNGLKRISTHPDDVKLVKEATDIALTYGIVSFDNLHHAPACPANHYHQSRLPTGQCTCVAWRISA